MVLILIYFVLDFQLSMFFQPFIPCFCWTPLAHLILGNTRVCGNCHLCIIRTKLICLHEVIIPNAVSCFCIYGFNLESYLAVGLFAQHTKSADLCGGNGVATIWTMAMLQRSVNFKSSLLLLTSLYLHKLHIPQ